MRLQASLGLTFACLALPLLLWADSRSMTASKAGETVSTEYGLNEARVDKLEGTIMVQKNNGSKPFALETGSTVEKGDTLTAYDQSWVILKTHKGDRIGMEGDTVMTVDEYYIEGPDRQIRLILNKGTFAVENQRLRFPPKLF